MIFLSDSMQVCIVSLNNGVSVVAPKRYARTRDLHIIVFVLRGYSTSDMMVPFCNCE